MSLRGRSFTLSRIDYSDPLNIVSDNTPDADVEVLEGAGTVAITPQPEPDPIEQAIQSVQPTGRVKQRQVGTAYGGARTSSIGQVERTSQRVDTSGVDMGSLTQAGQERTQNIRDKQNYDVGQIMDTFEYSAPTEFRQANYDLLQSTVASPQLAEQLNSAMEASQEFIQADTQRAIETARNAGITADQTSDKEIADMVRNQYAINSQFSTGSAFEGSVQWDNEQGKYVYTEPKARDTQTAVMVTGALLAPGIGGAIAGAGASSVAVGAATAAVNAGVQQVVTGDVDWGQAIVAGVGAGVDNYLEAANTAQEVANNLQNIAETGNAGERAIAATQVASATQKATEMAATAEVLNNIQTTIDIVQAVEDKDILKAADLGLSLAGSSTVSSIVNENLTNAGVPSDYLDVATSTVITAADTAIKGGDVGDVVQESVNNILIETVATEDNIRQTFNLSTEGFDDTLTKTLSSLTKEALEGGNREEILGKGLEAFVKNLPESDTESPEYLKQVEEWWHNNIEDPFEAWWQEIEPQREVIEQAMQSTVDTVKNVAQQAVDVVDEAVRALPPTKEDLEQLVADVKENVVDPAVGVVRETGRAIEEGYDVAEDFVKEDVAPVVRETGRDIREFVDPAANVIREVGRGAEELYGQAEDFVKEDVAPVVREIGRDIRDLVPEADAPEVDTADVDLPSVDVDMPTVSADPEITKRNMSYFYDDSSLLRNPLLRSSDMTVQDLTRLLQQEEIVRQAQAEEEERIKRSKPVYGFNPNISVG